MSEAVSWMKRRVAIFAERRGFAGGPGGTRTPNQTVMSGERRSRLSEIQGKLGRHGHSVTAWAETRSGSVHDSPTARLARGNALIVDDASRSASRRNAVLRHVGVAIIDERREAGALHRVAIFLCCGNIRVQFKEERRGARRSLTCRRRCAPLHQERRGPPSTGDLPEVQANGTVL